MNNNDVKIFIGYYKPTTLFKSDILIPLHCGRAVVGEKSKCGKLNKSWIKWLKTNTVGDDTGDNISKYNRYLNEMTGIYWMWKHQQDFGNPAYIGFMQYAKHFLFDSKIKLPDSRWVPEYEGYLFDTDTYVKTNNLSNDNILKVIADNDCVCPNKINLLRSASVKTCRQQMDILSKGYGYVFDIMVKVVETKYPQYKKYLNEIKNGCEHYPLNCFIMKKDLFNKYCEFVFGVLLEVMKESHLENANIYQKRAPGYCAEFLTSMFISSLRDKKIKTCKMCILYQDNEKEYANIQFKKIYKYILSINKENHRHYIKIFGMKLFIEKRKF